MSCVNGEVSRFTGPKELTLSLDTSDLFTMKDKIIQMIFFRMEPSARAV
jgi:hypothetical protein